MSKRQLELLVGDNAFHGISHLSQQRVRERSTKENPSDVEHAAKLVRLSLQNGATGFMFSVSETTLSILKTLDYDNKPDLYAIIPYAYEYVRLATTKGGLLGLAKSFLYRLYPLALLRQILLGLITAKPTALLKTYLTYEISRIKSAAGKDAKLKSVLLHEIITDMALALDLDWLFKAYIDFLNKSKIRPGFETRNFPYLTEKFEKWSIDMSKLTITSSFNKIGFQMNPSQKACEKAIENTAGSEVIAMSTLAAGYLKPAEALDYLRTLPNLKGTVVGVSKEYQAEETFRLFKKNVQTI
jgi:hypothetical protein